MAAETDVERAAPELQKPAETGRGCGLESDTAGGQKNRTEWWPLLSDGAWQPLDGGTAAWIMLNYSWQAARKP